MPASFLPRLLNRILCPKSCSINQDKASLWFSSRRIRMRFPSLIPQIRLSHLRTTLVPGAWLAGRITYADLGFFRYRN